MNLPRKLITGDLFKPAVVNTINLLIDFIASLRLTAGAGLRLSQTPAGTVLTLERAHGSAPRGAAASTAYDGMFAIHADTGAMNAGVITGPGWIANVNASTLTFPTADGTYYVILSVGTSGTGTPGRSIEISSTFTGLNDALPGTNGDVQKYLLATLTVADGAATIVQQQHGPVYMNIYRLAPEEDA